MDGPCAPTAEAPRRGHAAPLVPPHRLGALLHRVRARSERSLAAVARRVPGWTPSALAALERGEPVPGSMLGPLVDAYGVDRWVPGPGVPQVVLDRSTVIDANDGAIPEMRDALVRLVAVSSAWGAAPDPDSTAALVAEWAGRSQGEVHRMLGTVNRSGHRAAAEWLSSRRGWSCVPAAGFRIGDSHVGSLAFVVPVGPSGPDDGHDVVMRLGDLATVNDGRPGPALSRTVAPSAARG